MLVENGESRLFFSKDNQNKESPLKSLMREEEEESTSEEKAIQYDLTQILQWINEVKDPILRENALFELSRKREAFPDLAIYLFFSTGILSVL
jgi:hypothetical protein